MSKKETARPAGRSRADKLQKRVARAQESLERAQRKRADVMRRGEERVERARAKAASHAQRVTARVERRGAELSRLEQQLRASRAGTPYGTAERETPEMAAEDLQARQRDQAPSRASSTIIVPDGAGQIERETVDRVNENGDQPPA